MRQVVIQQQDATTVGQKKANTYTSGAPNPAGAMTTGQVAWRMWGLMTGVTARFSQLNHNPPQIGSSYNTETTVGDRDEFEFEPLTVTPANIYHYALKAMVQRSDAGAKTIDLESERSGTTTTGSASGQAPGTSPSWVSSYFQVDPASGVAPTAAHLNDTDGQIKVAT